MSSGEERFFALGAPVEDPGFIELLRSRLFSLLQLTRNPEMFPGSQPVSFERRHLEALEREDYYVCEKSDGMRYLLYFAIPPSGPVAFLIDRNYNFRALDHLTLPTRDLKGFQEETLLDGELVWDEGKGELVYYIFDGIMFMARSLASLDLNGRLQVVQNDVIGPYDARRSIVRDSLYEQPFPFKLKLKQMWKPYGLEELFERVIPLQGHENDGLIFTPVRDGYQAGTCHRLLKWKPSEMNSIDFLLVRKRGSSTDDKNNNSDFKYDLHIATQGRTHFYSEFDIGQDPLLKDKQNSLEDGCIAEFRMDSKTNRWLFMRFRPDKRLPNDCKTVEKVIHSIRDNVSKTDLLQRATLIRTNWKARESLKNLNIKSKEESNIKSIEESMPIAAIVAPRSQILEEPPFKYPLNLRTAQAKASYQDADGWLVNECETNDAEEPEEDKCEDRRESKRTRISKISKISDNKQP